ncbi:MAG: DNA oxidative demethylase AlkB [Methylophilaceae bacterium]|nr:DNA oxidative demethylase AlkB [Methyloradius sp.]
MNSQETLPTAGLFSDIDHDPIQIAEGAMVLPGFAQLFEIELIQAIETLTQQAPFRHMQTPSGYSMSVAMSNCGTAGWVTDQKGYRYTAIDPQTGLDWPDIPAVFMQVAQTAAWSAGYKDFVPDACLINRYTAGARMGLHQDKNEQVAAAPVVSISLGLSAIFMFGGLRRSDKTKRYKLEHGDVVVWGGASRFNFHGIAPLKPGIHPLLGEQRINLTFRKALADSA